MKFDTVIIGGGLSGLVCGIYLAQQGEKCAIVSAGQSALHFSSGSFDLLNTLPDGTPVEHPLSVMDELEVQAPKHPYVKLGRGKVAELANLAEDLLCKAGVSVNGNAGKNHFRVTPMGTMKPTWLTLDGYATSVEAGKLPWKKVALFNIAGFLDFYTNFIVDEFKKLGVECSVHLFNMDALEHLRKNPSEMRSANIARVFENQGNLAELGRILKGSCNGSDVIMLPAVLGLDKTDMLKYLKDVTGCEVLVLPTLPPSVPGIHAQLQLRKYFQELGGVYMLGDNVMRADIEEGKVIRLYSYNHGNIPFVAENVVLATGSYFSQGLIATDNQVYEPVFGLDIEYPADREQWMDLNFFAKQAYQSFGVKTDASFRAVRQGKVLENLYVAGAVLEGFNALKEGCGAGVSLLTALEVGKQIIGKRL